MLTKDFQPWASTKFVTMLTMEMAVLYDWDLTPADMLPVMAKKCR